MPRSIAPASDPDQRRGSAAPSDPGPDTAACGGPIATRLTTRLRRSELVGQFLKFTASGAVGTAVHFALLILLRERLGTDPVLASGIGMVGGALVNYVLAHRVVFRSRARHHRALPSFMAVALVGLGINTAIMYGLTHYTGLHYLLCQVLATGFVLGWNFLANRFWTFRH